LTEASGQKVTFRQDAAGFKLLVERGLRAQLETQSFVTGQVGVALDMHPGTPVRLTGLSPGYTEVPTVPSDLQRLTETLQNLPIAEIMASPKDTLDSIRGLVKEPPVEVTLKDFQALARGLDEKVAKLSASLDRTLPGADDMLADGSPVRASLVTALDELAEAAASIRTLANYLERNPNSLVFGKARAAQ